jgi:hypothetical protein
MITSPLLFKVLDGDKVGALAMTRACSCDQAAAAVQHRANSKKRRKDEKYIEVLVVS